MSSPYDLSKGNKGYPALVAAEDRYVLRTTASHIRRIIAPYDNNDSSVRILKETAGNLEKRAMVLEEKMRTKSKE
ncbi:MAG: hypothetical protein ACMXYL_05345 [Candidatus Woesearchaeota archaeon]